MPRIRRDIFSEPFPAASVNLPFTKKLVPIHQLPSTWKGSIYVLYETRQVVAGPVSDPRAGVFRPKNAINSIAILWQKIGGRTSADDENTRTLRAFFNYHANLNRQRVRKVVGVYGLL